jgi:hypothetical protein
VVTDPYDEQLPAETWFISKKIMFIYLNWLLNADSNTNTVFILLQANG